MTFWLKLIISLGLILLLASMVDWKHALEAIGETNKLLLVMSPFCFLLGLAAAAHRWQLALAGSEVAFSFRQAYKGYLIGLFYNVFLPGAIGGDVMRMALCTSQTRCSAGTAAASVLVERVAGVLALLTFLFGAFLVFPASMSPLVTFEPALLVALAIGVIGFVAIVRSSIWQKWLARVSGQGKVATFIQSGLKAFQDIEGQTLARILLLSAVFQGGDIAVTFLLARALDLDVPFTALLGVVPLVYLATVLPISLGGLGVREGTLAFLLARYGVAASDAITLSFLVYLNRVLVGSIGGGVQLLGVVNPRDLLSRRRVG